MAIKRKFTLVETTSENPFEHLEKAELTEDEMVLLERGARYVVSSSRHRKDQRKVAQALPEKLKKCL